MTSYANALAATVKAPVWILEFPDHGNQRFTSSAQYTLGSSAASPGLIVREALTTKLELRTGKLAFGEVECVIVDQDNTAGNFFFTNDATMRSATARLKYGFADVAEASFQTINLLVSNYRRVREGIQVTLASALHFLDVPLYENYTDEGFNLRADLSASGTVVSVGGDLTEAEWESAGHLMLSGQQTHEVELIEYSSFAVQAQDRTDVAVASRRKFSVGAPGKVWSAQETGVDRVWAFSEDPIEMFLRFATTTNSTAGTNGTWDAGDGFGLGATVPVAAIDTAAFVALRDGALADSGAPRLGIYIGKEEIRSVMGFFIDEFLALGLRFAIKGDGTLTVNPYPDLKETAAATAGKLVVEGIVPVNRNWDDRENNVLWGWSFNPIYRTFHSTFPHKHTRSQTRFGKSKLRKVEARGLYGAAGRAFGFPDLGWDTWMRTRAGSYLVDFADPSPELTVKGFLSLQDTEVGSLLTVTHAGIWDMNAGTMGITDELVYAASVERNPNDGDVKMGIRRRKLIGRPAKISPDGFPVYGSATAIQKQWAFVSPDSDANFADGLAPYEVAT